MKIKIICKICNKEFESYSCFKNKKYCSKECYYRSKRGILEKNNPRWKGDNVGYDGIHRWIRKYKPKKEYCEHCGENKKLEAANISGLYKRDFNDFMWLCSKCHYKYDNRSEKMSKKLKNRKFSEEAKRKMSKTKKRLFQEGKLIPVMLGKHHTEETKRKLREYNIGKKHTEETRKKMSMSLKGRIGWNKGKKCPQISEGLKKFYFIKSDIK